MGRFPPGFDSILVYLRVAPLARLSICSAREDKYGADDLTIGNHT